MNVVFYTLNVTGSIDGHYHDYEVFEDVDEAKKRYEELLDNRFLESAGIANISGATEPHFVEDRKSLLGFVLGWLK